MRAILIGLALALSAALLSRGAAAETYVIDSGVWGAYQEYLKKIGKGVRPGAFAISKDGQSAFYTWCPDTRCRTRTTYNKEVLDYCGQTYGTECVLFAVRDEIKVQYEIASAAPSVPSLSTLAPAPVATIGISPQVQAEIDTYLGNAKSSGRAWALAIANDGSDVEIANCPINSGYSGGKACDPRDGAPQELANREAIKRCGGTARCVLLYVGEQKQGGIEIVAR
ncbi:hypothetical protein [Dongia deserti]|uniref:hypothetical protein n=1 Tax=Dongia deserti TaxID=2268030 RepID=UPI000E650302|nr:hypothetical protein [Dongia deserti]